MSKNWIDFKELRKTLDFEVVLKHYGVVITRKCDQHHGVCPLPTHGEQKKSATFSANLKRGIFNCFGCGAKGNLLDFAVLMEGADTKDGKSVRRVARKLLADLSQNADSPENQKLEDKAEPQVEESGLPVVVNQPLDFKLKGLDSDHEYLKTRGLTSEIISHFGIGFCSRGLLKDKIAIPLHNQDGELIGYAGQVMEETLVNVGERPEYKFPLQRKRKGEILEFRKTLFLYNGFRLEHCNDLVVVDDISSVWWLHQNGFPETVAVMGAGCSAAQAELVVSLANPSGRVWVLGDDSALGERFAMPLLRLVSPRRFVRWVKLPDGRQPTQLNAGQLETLLSV